MQTFSATKTQSWLSWFLRGVLILGFLIIFGRVTELTIIKGNYFRDLAEGNRIRRVTITAPRGRILGRGGEELIGSSEVKRAIPADTKSGILKSDDLGNAAAFDIITEYTRNYIYGSILAHVSGYLGEVNESEVGTINPICPGKGPLAGGGTAERSG